MPKFLEVTDKSAARAAIGARSVATIAALKAGTSAVASGDYAQVLGYYAAGDGGGGLFRWDASDTSSTDNGGTVITPTNSGLAAAGRWKRVNQSTFNVLHYGAKGDGIEDDTAAIQTAIDDAADSMSGNTDRHPGVSVLFPAGLYLAANLIVPSNVTLEGDAATIQAKSGTTGYLITYTTGNLGGMKHLRVIAANQTENLGGIHVTSTRRAATFSHCSVENFHGRAFYGEGLNPILLRCYMYGLAGNQSALTTHTGVVELATAAHDAFIGDDCEINGGRWHSTLALRTSPAAGNDMYVCALALIGVQFPRIQDVVLENAETGLYANLVGGIKMSGVRSEFNWGHGFHFVGGSGRLTDLQSLDNSKIGEGQFDGYHWDDAGPSNHQTANLVSWSNFGFGGSNIKHRYGIYDAGGHPTIYNTHFNPRSFDDLTAFSGVPADVGGGSGYTFPQANSAVGLTGATPNITGKTIFRATGSTTITNFIGGVAGQIFYILGNGSVNVAHNSTVHTLSGAATLLASGQWYPFMLSDGVYTQLDLSGSVITGKTISSGKYNYLYDTAGAMAIMIDANASSVNALRIRTTASGGPLQLLMETSDNNGTIRFVPKGTGGVSMYAGTGVTPTLFAEGADSNHDINIVAKGTGVVKANSLPVVTTTGTQTMSGKTITNARLDDVYGPVGGAGTGGLILRLGDYPNAANWFVINNSTAGSPLEIKADGPADANVDIRFVPKGNANVGIWAGTGKKAQIYVNGPDTNHDINFLPQGSAGKVTVNSNPVGVKVSVPANATASGLPGQWAADTSYLYIYTGDGSTHTWRRVGIASW